MTRVLPTEPRRLRGKGSRGPDLGETCPGASLGLVWNRVLLLGEGVQPRGLSQGGLLIWLTAVPLCPTGPRLSGGHSLHETSTVLVETVTKSSSSRGSSYSSIPKFSSDASKVVTRGPGLSQAFVGQKNSFTVDCSKAGMLWEGTGRAPRAGKRAGAGRGRGACCGWGPLV